MRPLSFFLAITAAALLVHGPGRATAVTVTRAANNSLMLEPEDAELELVLDSVLAVADFHQRLLLAVPSPPAPPAPPPSARAELLVDHFCSLHLQGSHGLFWRGVDLAQFAHRLVAAGAGPRLTVPTPVSADSRSDLGCADAEMAAYFGRDPGHADGLAVVARVTRSAEQAAAVAAACSPRDGCSSCNSHPGVFVNGLSARWMACALDWIEDPPTPAPTPAPTPSPTGRPTPTPTKQPTRTPTPAPTPSPTTAPTEGPTRAPTDAPTGAPTAPPTDTPTNTPTRAPTRRPTTPAPTGTPTAPPTGVPTTPPTRAPTKAPTTAAPTRAPTKAPTKTPTGAPTNAPTRTPTAPPTLAPTNAPTQATLPPLTTVTLPFPDHDTERTFIHNGVVGVLSSTLKLMRCSNTACTTSSTVQLTVSPASTLLIDVAANPATGNIGFLYRTNTDALYLAQCSQALCSTGVTTQQIGSKKAYMGALKYDSSSMAVAVVLVQADATNQDTHLIRCRSTTCTSFFTYTIAQLSVQGSSAVPHDGSLVIDSSRRPVVALTFINHGQVLLIVCGNTDCTSHSAKTLAANSERDALLTASVILRSNNFPVVVSGDGQRIAGVFDDDLDFYYCGDRSCATFTTHRLTSTSFEYERIFLGMTSTNKLVVITYYRVNSAGVTDGRLRLIKCGSSSSCASPDYNRPLHDSFPGIGMAAVQSNTAYAVALNENFLTATAATLVYTSVAD